MVELNINDLSDEEIKNFASELLSIIETVQNELTVQKKEIVAGLGGEPQRITNLKMTPKGKLLFLAKKIAKNTFISAFTGISPEFLNTDTSAITREKNDYAFYLRQNLGKLIYYTSARLNEKTLDLVNLLKSEDVDRIKEYLVKVNQFYKEVYDVDYGSGKKYVDGSDRYYGIMYAYYLYNTGIDNEEIYFMARALNARGVGIGPKYDFIKDMKDVYENNKHLSVQKGK